MTSNICVLVQVEVDRAVVKVVICITSQQRLREGAGQHGENKRKMGEML